MDLLEYQGKELFRRAGLRISRGVLAKTLEDVVAAAEGHEQVVLKAQVPAGHRGVQGGVVIVKADQARRAATSMFKKKFAGFIPQAILVEEFVPLAEELYLSLLVNRDQRRLEVLFLKAGGVDIESRKSDIERYPVPLTERAVRTIGKDLAHDVREHLVDLIGQLQRLMVEQDALLVEVNPLGLTTEGTLVCIDSKVTIDDNALYRHPALKRWQAPQGKVEALAKKAGISYVPLDGSIGLIGNGAGLVMATLDAIAQAGGKAANFLDVGGGARSAAMQTALTILASQKKVRAILINLFGGITRTDELATALVDFIKKERLTIPLVVRVVGRHAEQARQILSAAKIPAEESMQSAVQRIVSIVGGSRATKSKRALR
jgi:succinyl-CoA synthetase beta subunit